MITTLNACWKSQISEETLAEIMKGNRDFSGYEPQIGMLFNSVSIEQIMLFCMKFDISWHELALCYKKAIEHGSQSTRFEKWLEDMGESI